MQRLVALREPEPRRRGLQRQDATRRGGTPGLVEVHGVRGAPCRARGACIPFHCLGGDEFGVARPDLFHPRTIAVGAEPRVRLRHIIGRWSLVPPEVQRCAVRRPAQVTGPQSKPSIIARRVAQRHRYGSGGSGRHRCLAKWRGCTFLRVHGSECCKERRDGSATQHTGHRFSPEGMPKSGIRVAMRPDSVRRPNRPPSCSHACSAVRTSS